MNNEQAALIIKNELKKNNKSITNMIEDLKLGKSFMQNFISRGSKPSIEKMESIANYLNISLDYLIGREEETQKYNIRENQSIYGDIGHIQKNGTNELSYIDMALMEKIKVMEEAQKIDLLKNLSNKGE